MAKNAEDVENWLSALSYHEIQQIAGGYSIKKNQKRKKLITLLKKVVKDVPTNETLKETSVNLQDGDHLFLEGRRKRRHSLASSAGDEVAHSSSPVSNGKCTEPETKRICDNEKEIIGTLSGQDPLNTTFEVSEPKAHLNMPDVSSQSFSANETEQYCHSNSYRGTSWISDDGEETNKHFHNLTDDNSFMVTITSEDGASEEKFCENSENVLSIKQPNQIIQKTRPTGTNEYNNEQMESVASRKGDAVLSFQSSERRSLGIGEKGTEFVGIPTVSPVSKSCENSIQRTVWERKHVNNVSKIDNLASSDFTEKFSSEGIVSMIPLPSEVKTNVKKPQRGKLTAQFAAKHQKLLRRGMNIEEDAKRVQELHKKHEKEVPGLFKRLATPKRRKLSGIPVPVRNAINQQNTKGYDFSQSKTLSKMSFNFGTLDPSKTPDIKKAFDLVRSPARSPARSALQEYNQSVPSVSEGESNPFGLGSSKPDLVGSCPRFLRNHTPERRTLTDRKPGGSHRKPVPFVDTMTMSDLQFETAKKEGRLKSFLEANKKNAKYDRKLF